MKEMLELGCWYYKWYGSDFKTSSGRGKLRRFKRLTLFWLPHADKPCAMQSSLIRMLGGLAIRQRRRDLIEFLFYVLVRFQELYRHE